MNPELCCIHTLTVDHIDSRGIWLKAGDQLAHMPRKEAPLAIAGEALELFLYLDLRGKLQATSRRPLVQSGEFALLTVSSVDQHGAFLDWGMAKDLLAPFSLQPERMQVGQRYLVKVALDSQGRPFANARIEECLERGRPELADGEAVSLIFWQYNDLGARMIVNSRFPGLLYREELTPGLAPGMKLSGYVKHLREDGKLDVTLRRVGAEGVADAREAILKALAASGGTLLLHDQSPPELILQTLGISKKSFKKGVGGLYKDGLLILGNEGIRLKKHD